MNKLNKIFLIIIVILIIILIVAINRCFYFANAYKSVATNMMHLTEKANQIEKDYNRNTENNFGPHLSVNAKDIQTESLANVTHGVIAQVTEARI